MSKPIINGIDVSECEYFNINRGFNCYKGHNCTDKECSDCYFKQLKRLEQENKELKEQLAETKQFLKNDSEENSKLCQQIEAYRLSENEAKEIIAELKSRNANLRLNLATYDLPEIKKVLTDWRTGELDRKFNKLKRENKKLEKTLKEIRSYCDEQNLKVDYTACYITNRIDEVLNDRD